jgi:hypothetical protein
LSLSVVRATAGQRDSTVSSARTPLPEVTQGGNPAGTWQPLPLGHPSTHPCFSAHSPEPLPDRTYRLGAPASMHPWKFNSDGGRTWKTKITSLCH